MITPLQLRVDQITEQCRERDAAIHALRESLMTLTGRWRRPCWICGRLVMCEHREPELVERWDQGEIA
jgi:hypothetical protein